MFKPPYLVMLLLLAVCMKGSAQSSAQLPSANYQYHAPRLDKLSWQWLNLMTSATYYRVVKEGEVDFNSCLGHVSRSLGLSRFSVLAEGIDEPQLHAKSSWIDKEDPAAGKRMLAGLTGRERLQQLILLGAYYTFQPRADFRKDSAQYFLETAVKESRALNENKLRRQALCLLGKMFLEVNEGKQADSIFTGLLQECRDAGDKQTEARALFYWAMFPEYHPATTAVRIGNFQKAAALSHELENREAEINAMTDAAYMMVTTFALPEAKGIFLKALELAEQMQYPYTHYLTDALAMVTGFQGKFGEPLKYTFQTIKTAEVARDSIGWAYFYSRLGAMYKAEEGRTAESLTWFSKALDRFVKAGDAGLSVCLFDIATIEAERGGNVLELVTKIARQVPPVKPRDQIYYKLALSRGYQSARQVKKAEQLVAEAAELEEQFVILRRQHSRSMFNLILGEITYQAGELERSRKYFQAYLADPFRLRIIRNDLGTYTKLAKIDSATGNFAGAYAHFNTVFKLLDSSFNVSQKRQAEELQVLYQTAEKENQIILLNQQARLEQANLKQAMFMRNMTIGGIVLVAIIAALIFRQSRQRKKNNTVVTQKNQQLQHLLTEKEWLLKEIHHRVKNNLQVVMSLLNSQTAFIDNEPALTAIHDSQHRVHAMSLIHQKLYNTENVSAIEMSLYVRELVSYLTYSFNAGQRVRINYNVESFWLDVGQAVPLGLILNEAITNSLKYAFPNNSKGEISISLACLNPRRCRLEIADNGVGMPAELTKESSGSLGMSLMRGLTDDLEGDIAIENNNGTTVIISFPLDQHAKRLDIHKVPAVSNN
jgi:two-component system, sensor histidine kinase PdtaS